MNSEQGLAAGQNPSWTLSFWNRVHRYRCLVTKFWWIMVFLLSTCLCLAAYYLATRPASYASSGSLIVEGAPFVVDNPGNKQTGGGVDEKFLDTQIDIMKGPGVAARAADRIMAQYPDVGAEILRVPVKIDYTIRNTIIALDATGSNPLYTQRYLEAQLNGYLDFIRAKRELKIDELLGKVSSESKRMEEKVRQDDADIISWQREKGVVFEGNGNAGGNTELANLRRRLGELHTEYDQLTLTSPEQSLSNPIPHRAGGDAAVTAAEASSPQQQSTLESSSASSEYHLAQQSLAKLQEELDERYRAHELKDKHPKMVQLKEDISRQQKIIASLIVQSKEITAHRLALVGSLIKTLEQQIETAKGSALNNDLLHAEFDQKVANKERDMKSYADLQVALRNGTLSTNVNQEQINIAEHASVGQLVPSNYVKVISIAILAGLALGVGVLLLIDRMDDRMNSISDFQLHFAEHVIGQIPCDAKAEHGENTELLRPDDPRHQLVESFRNLRSTLLFMPLDGVRPKTLLITSAVPNEGKSTVSSNLALVLASAGMKTLLIDADLRRGAIHQAFGLSRDPGLTDVLGHSVNWKLAIRESGVENLHILPRGRNVQQPSEYLLNRSTDLLLKELYPLYDYIVIDSSPVLAADDTASLAPKIDATLFVVRLSFTSAKMTRKALEILYKRQANIPGLILNQVDTSSPDFVYYQYSEYYNTAPVDDEPAVKTS